MMISEKQEQEFKDMIQSIGYESAPDHLVRSVIEKLEHERAQEISITHSLIPRWMWLSLGTVFCISLVYFMSNYQTIEYSFFKDFSYDLSMPNMQFNGLPKLEFEFGKLGGIALCLLFPALLIQFYFIKGFYENRV